MKLSLSVQVHSGTNGTPIPIYFTVVARGIWKEWLSTIQRQKQLFQLKPIKWKVASLGTLAPLITRLKVSRGDFPSGVKNNVYSTATEKTPRQKNILVECIWKWVWGGILKWDFIKGRSQL